jgi:hypothetical protein
MAWFQVCNQAYNVGIQVGWYINREPGVATRTLIYWEQWNGGSMPQDKQYLPVSLSDGDIVEMHVIFTSGFWHISYSINGGAWIPMNTPNAPGYKGTYISFYGAIHNSQDDMPGTQSDPCTITGCVYSTGSGLVNVGLDNANRQWSPSTDAAKCKWYINAINYTDLEMWDWCPLP